MTVMKTAESFQATYVMTSVPKTVSVLKENQDDLRQEFQESKLLILQHYSFKISTILYNQLQGS